MNNIVKNKMLDRFLPSTYYFILFSLSYSPFPTLPPLPYQSLFPYHYLLSSLPLLFLSISFLSTTLFSSFTLQLYAPSYGSRFT